MDTNKLGKHCQRGVCQSAPITRDTTGGEWCAEHAPRTHAGKLLSVSADAKTVKGQAYGYLTGIMYLAPSTLSGRNLCPDASPGCIAACLNTAGRGVFTTTQTGRIKRSHFFRENREAFMTQLHSEICALVRKAERMGLTPLVRLNGTSDIPWENVPVTITGPSGEKYPHANIMSLFPRVQFYDYTKSHARMGRYLNVACGPSSAWPSNYSLTFSRSECNETQSLDVLQHGGNVSVVFSTARHKALPIAWNGYRVIDGDVNDARPDDATYFDRKLAQRVRPHAYGFVIGLRAKGRARRDTSGFVVNAGLAPCWPLEA